MKSNTSKQKILDLLFDYPTRRFHIREISRLLNISAPAVSNAVKELSQEQLLMYKPGFVSEITANLSDKFKNMKRVNNLNSVYQSGLFEYVSNNFPMSTIVVFGSYSRGEDIEKSDIDIAIIAESKNLEVEKFEKILKRKINIEIADFRNISGNLRESIINGIILQGTMTL